MLKEEKYILNVGKNRNVDFRTKHGAEIYRRSLTVLLQCAVTELYPDLKIQIGQSLMNGSFFEIPREDEFPKLFIKNVMKRMRDIVNCDEKFIRIRVSKEKAIKLYKLKGRNDKARAISFLKSKSIDLVYLRNYFDYLLAECVSSTKFLKTFKIIRYKHGFIIQYPVRGNIDKLPDNFDRQSMLYDSYVEAKIWDSILNIHHVSDLNDAVLDGSISTLIKVQEAFHEKKIAYIADNIKSNFPEKRIILVAGPSASGKTTFIKRLGIQLRTNGLIPEELNLDNYFVNRDKTPRTDDGDYDYECLEALDVKLIIKHISSLMTGKSIVVPKYNFKTGQRQLTKKKMKLKENSLILIEGIHGLNPGLTKGIPEASKYKIFVSALTQLFIDNDTRIFTSDTRLMRRLIRDSLYRGYKPVETLKMFPKVRRGEDNYIFPYQKYADSFFNSSLIYEQAILKPFIRKLLKGIDKNSPEYYESRRILKYLDFFLPISAEEVPQVSILREFIGKSGFKY